MKNFKSRSMRRVYKKTPGNRIVLHLEKRMPRKAHCATCGGLLKGVPRERPFRMKNMPKTMKRPERPYGGMLCSKCTRQLIIDKARA